jgi:DNA-binding XRE family transcriptional regulator
MLQCGISGFAPAFHDLCFKQFNITKQQALMNKDEFKKYRKRLDKTQKQMAELLGTSLKAVHSYEQGWRRVPTHVERQIFFLISRLEQKGKKQTPCWRVKKCPPEQKKACPAWEFSSGDLCWFINGTICDGMSQKDWKEKMKICRSCEVFSSIL